MDNSIFLAVAGSTFTIIAVIISLFLWLRSEANTDRRELHAIQREDRKDILKMISTIQDEISDFHKQLIKQGRM